MVAAVSAGRNRQTKTQHNIGKFVFALYIYPRSKMSVFEPNSRHLREVLIFCFHLTKTVAKAHRIHSSTYGEAALRERTCCEWFQRFKSGDFAVQDRHGGGKEKIFQDSELEALLAEDSFQTQEEFQNHCE